MIAIRRALDDQRVLLAVTALMIAVTFILTDHRRDFVGFGTETADGAAAGPVVVTTIARFALLGFAVVLLVIGTRRPQFMRSPAALVLGAFALYLGASTAWSADPAFTFRKLVVLATLALTAFCIAQVFDLDQIADLMLAVLAGYLVLGAIYEIATGSVRFLVVYRFAGTTGASQNGMFAALVALIAGIRLLFGSTSRRARILYIVLLAMAGGFTAITISRTAMFAFAATVVFAAALQATSSQASGRLRGGLLVTAIAVVGAVAFATLSNHRSANLGSLGYRSPLWEPLWEAIQERPISGYGYLSYWISGERNRVENSHSVYLDLLLDGGVLGLLLFVAALVLVGWKLAMASRNHATTATMFGLCLVCFALVHGLAESSFIRPTIALFFLACVVIRVALVDSGDADLVPSEVAGEQV